MFVRELIKQVPMSVKQEVYETSNRYNRPVREILRSETRLGFQSEYIENPDRMEVCRVAVSVDKLGMPDILDRIPIDQDLELATRLSQWRSWLYSLRDSCNAVKNMYDQLEKDLQKIPKIGSYIQSLQQSKELSQLLLEESKKINIVKKILAINEDVLGAYFYNPNDQNQKRGISAQIYLYWGVIGLVARSLNVDLESLVVLVLAHELAHAYTHLGFDIDGNRWSGRTFADAQHELKEGLAQYYTYRVMGRLQKRLPLGEKAYNKLLAEQPPAYHSHERWIEETTPERIRAALISFRNTGDGRFKTFNDLLSIK